MNKSHAVILIFIFLTFHITGQTPENKLTLFQQQFKAADLDIKHDVLQDAAAGDIEGMGPLFLDAIRYVIDNADLLDEIPLLREMALFSIACINTITYRPAKFLLWKLFLADGERKMRVAILDTLPLIASRDAHIIQNMVNWLDSQNSRTLTGEKPDLHIISAMLEALGTIGDPRALEVLLRTMTIGYLAPVTRIASRAIDMIQGDTTKTYLDIILEASFPVKKCALIKSGEQEALSDADKCRIAEFALDTALHSTQVQKKDEPEAYQIRRIAVNILGEKHWANAAKLVIEHFNQVITAVETGMLEKSYLLDAIEALGNMKSHEAAKRLTLYLELVNSCTENRKPYDVRIVLAVIKSLGKLGDRVSASALLAIRHLDYSLTIKNAAHDALKHLD
jgi:HEAT repeat protein